MTDKNDCQKACEDSAKAFMEAEQAIDRAARKLCNLMDANMKTQRCFADCDEVLDNDGSVQLPIHPNKFSDMHVLVGSAVSAITGARGDIADAHVLGDGLCKDGGIIIAGGGGGK